MKITVEITVCRSCGREMVPERAYRRYAELREKYVRRSAHGMCGGCQSRASKYGTLPEPAPAPRSGYQVRPCRGCGRDMVGQFIYRSRPELRAEYQPAAGYGLCMACYALARKYGTLPNPAPRTRPVRAYRPRAAADPAERHAKGEVTA